MLKYPSFAFVSFVIFFALSSASPAQHPLSPSPSTSTTTSTYQPPLVIWHGLGDSYDAEGLQSVAELANITNPQTFVHIIRLGDSGRADRSATFFGNLTSQLSTVCEQLASHPVLSRARGSGINALGFSQGGQFLRAYVERCNDPPVRNLVTFGAQHNGISEFQSCESATDWVCQSANALLRAGTWSGLVQSRLIPAQYFRDPEELDVYLEGSNFLADVNNEREGSRNETYKRNLASLSKFVMFLFKEDTTVVPKESGWFAEVNRTSEIVTPLRERKIYQEDWLGLKELDMKGGLVFEETEGGHMNLDDEVLNKTFRKYFGPVKLPDSITEDSIGRLQNLRGDL
ncbi:MAG: hypothetical protein Q9227_003875 [Pyrenula ochraceoflavens]